ncbi:DUF362 domain-containing protein [Occallatibacter savannae]|uniref:DUF362 domain-containing protein n=1 Tax=Occallatibacter savannae TaxID=1002691 RepID=UPI0013A5783B|nr:DUF362 domain-containing protein [Occallatibacter savannae]
MPDTPKPDTAAEPDSLSRREAMLQILRVGGVAAAATGAGFWLNSRSTRPVPSSAEQVRKDHRIPSASDWPGLAIAQFPAENHSAEQGEPRTLVQKVIESLGGMSRFVRAQDVVVIKPNIAWDRTPEQAANTNPELVAEVVRQCRDAGAKRVIVTDVSCNEARRCFHRSGIEAAARSAGAEIILPDPDMFRDIDLGGVMLKTWPVFIPFLEADKIINMPIAKHHGLCGVTLGMKNWYGILGGQRSRLHQQIHQSLVDLAGFMLPTLTIMDCYRILLRNGPTGGDLEDVALKKTVVAGTDPVALDAYVAKAYWNLDPEHLPYLQLAANRGLGTVQFEQLAVKMSQLS